MLKFLKTLPKSWVYKTADRFKSGIPDILVLCQGKFIAIELKVRGKKAKPIQEYTLEKIQEAGGAGAVCYSVNEVKEFLTREGVI